MYRIKGKVPFESLLSVLTNTQQTRNWHFGEERKRKFSLSSSSSYCYSLRRWNHTIQVVAISSLRCMGLHWETKLGENKQAWLPAVFPEIWKLGITSSPPIRKSARRNPEAFLSLWFLMSIDKLHEDVQSPKDINTNRKL